ncbi:MAG TPA: hypothetical protein VI299_00250 [Polyangiales bacterium]
MRLAEYRGAPRVLGPSAGATRSILPRRLPWLAIGTQPSEIANKDDDLDADLVAGPEEELPRPDAAAFERACTTRLTPAKQHPLVLDGMPYSNEQVLRGLARNPLGRRHMPCIRGSLIER